MKKTVAGYVGTIGGALVGFLTIASLGEAKPNHFVTAVLVVMTIAMLGVGWWGLRIDDEEVKNPDEPSRIAGQNKEAA